MIRPSDSWHITHVPEPLNNVVSSDGRFCAFPADVTAKSKKIKIRIKPNLNKKRRKRNKRKNKRSKMLLQPRNNMNS